MEEESNCDLFQFCVLPFGISNALGTVPRLINTVLAGLIDATSSLDNACSY